MTRPGARRIFFGVWIFLHTLVFAFGFVNVSALTGGIQGPRELTWDALFPQYSLKGESSALDCVKSVLSVEILRQTTSSTRASASASLIKSLVLPPWSCMSTSLSCSCPSAAPSSVFSVVVLSTPSYRSRRVSTSVSNLEM